MALISTWRIFTKYIPYNALIFTFYLKLQVDVSSERWWRHILSLLPLSPSLMMEIFFLSHTVPKIIKISAPHCPKNIQKSLHKNRACHIWSRYLYFWFLSQIMFFSKPGYPVHHCIRSSRERLSFNAEIQIKGSVSRDF